MITDALIERIVGLQNPTCVGLDTSFDYLPEKMREGVRDFPRRQSGFSSSTNNSSITCMMSFRPSRCRSPIMKCTACPA